MKGVPLESVCEINPRDNGSSNMDDSAEVSFLPMAAVGENGGGIIEEQTRVLAEVRKGYTPFRRDDVLIAKITPCFQNGKLAIASISRAVGFGTTEFHVLRPRTGQLDNRYLFHFLRQSKVHEGGVRRMTGTGGQLRVPTAFLAELSIPLPPLAEQKRIAAVLDKADDLRAKRRHALATLDTLLQSVFLDMFGDPVTNPKGWPAKPLVDLIEDGRPITYGILKPGPDTPGGVPYIRVVDIKGGMVLEHNVRRTTPEMDHEFRRSRLRPGDLLLSIRGHVGRMAVVPPGLANANITQDTARLSTGPLLEPQYLLGCMLSASIQRWMEKHIRGVAVQGINIGDIRKIPIPVPPHDLQTRYANIAGRVISMRARAAEGIRATEGMFASLQSAAFAGTLFDGTHAKTAPASPARVAAV